MNAHIRCHINVHIQNHIKPDMKPIKIIFKHIQFILKSISKISKNKKQHIRKNGHSKISGVPRKNKDIRKNTGHSKYSGVPKINWTFEKFWMNKESWKNMKTGKNGACEPIGRYSEIREKRDTQENGTFEKLGRTFGVSAQHS